MPKKPFDLERYPHTHYHDYDQNWIYKEIGILKAWLFSLTKLWAKLAETDAEKYAEILDEINRLIKKIQTLIDSLTEMIKHVRDSFDAFATCLENLLSSMDRHIKDIEEDINNIYDLLKKILSQDFTSHYLTYNSDYTFNFYNGYYAQEDYNSEFILKQDTVIDAGSERYHSVKYKVIFNSFHSLRNSTTITANSSNYPQFSHGSENEQAYIVDINIPELKNMTVDSIETTSGVWNARPVDARASWNVVTSGEVLNNNVIRLIAQSIADGYNRQYTTYINTGVTSEITLSEGGLNTTAEINAHYTEQIS